MTKRGSANAPRSRRRATYHHGDLVNAIRAAALRLIDRRGAPTFTLRELANAVGVAHAALYAHFANKQALLEDLAVLGLRTLRDAQRARALDVEEPIQRLFELAQAYVDFARAQPGAYRLVFATDLATLHTPVVAAARSTAAALMRRTIEAAQRDRLIIEADPDVLAFALWSAAHGLAHLVVNGHVLEMDGAARDLDGTVRFVVASTLRGVATPKGRRAIAVRSPVRRGAKRRRRAARPPLNS